MHMKYPILISRTATGYSSSVPDLPGCVAVGGTSEETLALMAEAIELHLQGMREDGEDIPEPSDVEMVETRA
jgi:predicted RNase H-like HicB family nuclease